MKPTQRNLVGGRVQAGRVRHGWSQAKLAAKCQMLGWDVPRDTIASIELGRRRVRDFEVVLLAKALATPVQDLLPKGEAAALEASRT